MVGVKGFEPSTPTSRRFLDQARRWQVVHSRRTASLFFSFVSARSRDLIAANNPGGMKPYAKASELPGLGDRPALGHSSMLYVFGHDYPTRLVIKPDRLAHVGRNLDGDGIADWRRVRDGQ